MLPSSALILRDALARGEISSREATEHYLRQIDEHRDLGAFLYVSERAMEAAAAADEAFVKNRGRLGRLHGMPTAFKDLNDVQGMPTTHGSAAIEHKVAVQDHRLVARLRAEGVVVLGKTQVPEFGLSSYSENLVGDPARNPLDPSRSAGGSSGGQAAAVAAGLIPLGAGSDGGGSVRIPAGACGLVGLKPSLGRVPSDVAEGYTDRFGAPKLTVSGPLAKDALDAALLMDAMCDADRYLPALQSGAAERLSGLRIGYSTHSPFETAYDITLEPEAVKALELGLERLAGNHRVQRAQLQYAPDYPQAFTTVWTNGLKDIQLTDERALGTLAADYRRRAQARSESESCRAAARLTQIAADFIRQWSAYDVIATPTLAGIPPRIGHYTQWDAERDYMLQCQYSPFSSMVNVASAAAITVPVSTTNQGLSLGIQLISPSSNEAQLLALATQIAV